MEMEVERRDYGIPPTCRSEAVAELSALFHILYKLLEKYSLRQTLKLMPFKSLSYKTIRSCHCLKLQAAPSPFHHWPDTPYEDGPFLGPRPQRKRGEHRASQRAVSQLPANRFIQRGKNSHRVKTFL